MDRIPYYEPPYPEETHYSHILRLAKLNGFDRFLTFAEQYLMLKGSPRHSILWDSAQNLAPFFGAADINEPYSDYILNTTTYAFHAKFWDDCRQYKFINRMYQVDDRFNYSMLMDRKELYCCPECMKESAYFRRLHQIPGVNVCPKHKTPLAIYNEKYQCEFDVCAIGEPIALELSLDKEYEKAKFIYELLVSDIPISANSIRNSILSKIGDASQYAKFANKFMQSDYSSVFSNAKAVVTFLQTQIKRCNIPEDKAIAILLYLFKDYKHFASYCSNIDDNAESNDFLNYITDEEYTLISRYRSDIITVRHELCNKTFPTTPNMLMDGWLCPHCSKKMSNREFQQRLVDYYGRGEYEFIQEANTPTDKIKMKHKRCGREVLQIFDDFFFRGYKCKCWNMMSFEYAQNIIKNKGDFELVSFTNTHEPVTIKCNKCGQIRTYSDFSFTRRSIRCLSCESNNAETNSSEHIHVRKPRVDIKRVRSIIYNLVGSDYSVLDYNKINNDSHYSILVKHAECGKEFWTSYSGFLKGSRCQCEGLAVQAPTSELKRYIYELSCGQYVCCDDEIIDRNNIHIQNTQSGEIHNISYKLALQEITRITPSTILPCNNVNKNATKPRSAPMMFMEYLKQTYGSDGVFFLRDISYDAPKPWIASTLYSFTKRGDLKHLGWEIYVFSDEDIDWEKISRLFYIKQNDVRHGCTYGRSFLLELGIPVKHPPVHPHIMGRRKGRLTSSKPSTRENTQNVRTIGNFSIRYKEAPCEVTEENYKVLQVADYLGSYHNQNYPWLTEEQLNILAQYIRNTPLETLEDIVQYYPEKVQNKIKNMVFGAV